MAPAVTDTRLCTKILSQREELPAHVAAWVREPLLSKVSDDFQDADAGSDAVWLNW